MARTLQRAAQLGLLAKDLAGVRWRKGKPGQAAARQRLVRRLGLMHGLPQKIGQLLAFSELDASDPAFTRLTEDAPAMPAVEAFAEIGRQLGRPIEDCFLAIDEQGISASIGQVHRAVTLDGRDVAVKLQYPDIADAVECDLKALGWLTAPVGDLRRDFDMTAYRREIGAMLQSELDYRGEAERLQRFAHWTSADTWSGLMLPQPVPALSGPRLLTTTWMSGERLNAARQWSAPERTTVATLILHFFLHGTFRWRCLHADPHPGNYRFLRTDDGDVKLGVLDFGCVKSIAPGFAAGLQGLITDAQQGIATHQRVWERFLEMGFNLKKLEPMRDALAPVARVLTEPFVTKERVSATDWKPGARIAELLGSHRMAFRLAGPPEMIFFLRAFQGVLHYLKALAVPVHWREEFAAAIDSPEGPARKSDAAYSAAASRPVLAESVRPVKSDALHIQVTEANQTRVALTFGAAATDYLPDLVPIELRERLQQRAIDLKAIAEDARRRDYPPGELFTLVDGAKTVRVWLA